MTVMPRTITTVTKMKRRCHVNGGDDDYSNGDDNGHSDDYGDENGDGDSDGDGDGDSIGDDGDNCGKLRLGNTPGRL